MVAREWCSFWDEGRNPRLVFHPVISDTQQRCECEYKAYVEAMDLIGILQAKARAIFAGLPHPKL
jgi:hypothetical protein